MNLLGLSKIKFENYKICSTYQFKKQIKVSLKPKNCVSTSKPLELLHLDLSGSTQVISLACKRFAFIIVNDYSRYTWVLFLDHKDETFKNFVSLSIKIQNFIDFNYCQN